MSDQHNREYGILEIQESKLRFRYNLNSLRTEEKEIWLSAIYVDDGQWHTAKVQRYGSAAILTLDGGEGRRYNDSFLFQGHQVGSCFLPNYAQGKGILRFCIFIVTLLASSLIPVIL